MDTYATTSRSSMHSPKSDAPPSNLLGTFLAGTYWIFITLFLILQIFFMYKMSIFIHKSTERRRILTQLLHTPTDKRSDKILDMCYEYAAAKGFGTEELWKHLDKRFQSFTEQGRIGEDGEWQGGSGNGYVEGDDDALGDILERRREMRGVVEERKKKLWRRFWFNGVLKMNLYMTITMPTSVRDVRDAIAQKRKERVDAKAAGSCDDRGDVVIDIK